MPPLCSRPVSVGPTNPPPPSTLHETKRRVTHPLNTHLKEGDGKEGVGSRKKGGEEEKGGGEEEVEAAAKQEPGRHLPPTNDTCTQENGMCHRQRRRQCHRRPHSCCCNATALVMVAAPKRVPTPTKHPGGYPTHAPNQIPQPDRHAPCPNRCLGGADMSAPPYSSVAVPEHAPAPAQCAPHNPRVISDNAHTKARLK